MKYKRILLKISGEALTGGKGYGISYDVLKNLVDEIVDIYKLGTEIIIVIGGGNIHRGVTGEGEGINRTISDHMGMLATMINCLVLGNALTNAGAPAKVLSGVDMPQIAESFIQRDAVEYLKQGNILVLGAGTGNPYFTTDTAAALRASELSADVLFKATKVDGIYDKDPAIHKDAKKYEELTFIEALKSNIRIMDATAFSLCMENGPDIIVFNLFEKGNIKKACEGKKVGTRVTRI